MNRSMMQRIAIMTTMVLSLGTSSCGGLFDLTYLVGSKQYDERKEERKPTGQISTRIDYEGSVAPNGEISLSCSERDRRIERTFTVTKIYQYRGGFTRTTYVTAAILSAVAGGAVAGIVAIGCTLPPQPGEKDPKRWSCLNALYASPFALDLGYSLIRAGTAKTPKLIDKSKNESLLSLASVPSRSTPLSCDSIDRVVLGTVYGPSEVDVLNGTGGDGPKLVDGALAVARTPAGTINLATQPDVVHAWVQNPFAALYVVNREGKPSPLTVDRCGVLRPHILMMQPMDQNMFVPQCAPRNQPAPR